MRIERIETSKHKRGRVLVFLADGACLKITEQELLDFGLRAGDELDAETLKRLKAAAGVSDTKATAADLVGKRAMSRQTLEKKLRDKGASEAEARYAAEWLEAIGAIDDADYAEMLVRHYGNLGYGPPMSARNYMKKASPEICGTKHWMLCRNRQSISVVFWKVSSTAVCRTRRRKND